MKNCKFLFCLVFLVFLIFLGCAGRRSRTINIAGSTSVQPLAEALAEAYMKLYPEIIINVQGGGSSAGIEAVSEEVVNIGLSSRPLKDNETKLIPYKIAFDGVAIVVNPQNKIEELNLETLKKIYSGELKNWAEVFPTGARGGIDLVTREEGSGTREAFVKSVMAASEITPSAIVEDATGVVREIVATDAGAIGYISLGIVDERVKALKINGVGPSFETVKNKRYQISRPFLFVFKKEPEGVVKDFLNFVLSEKGQKIVRASGFVPVN